MDDRISPNFPEVYMTGEDLVLDTAAFKKDWAAVLSATPQMVKSAQLMANLSKDEKHAAAWGLATRAVEMGYFGPRAEEARARDVANRLDREGMGAAAEDGDDDGGIMH